MKVCIIGDSHVMSMYDAYQKGPSDFEKYGKLAIGFLLSHPGALKPFFLQTPTEVRFLDDVVSDRLKSVSGASSFCSGDTTHYLICMPYTTTIWLRLEQWQRFRPWRTCESSHQPVSDRAIAEMAMAFFRYLVDFALALKNLKLNVAIIEARPPRSDECQRRRDRGTGVRGATLLELDRLARKAISAALQAIPVIKPPSKAFDEAGFLRPCYLQPTDRHHANDEYGALMLNEIVRHLETVFPRCIRE